MNQTGFTLSCKSQALFSLVGQIHLTAHTLSVDIPCHIDNIREPRRCRSPHYKGYRLVSSNNEHKTRGARAAWQDHSFPCPAYRHTVSR